MSEDDLSFKTSTFEWGFDYSESLRSDSIVVVEGLRNYNESLTSFVPNSIWIFMRNKEKKVVGGLLGYTLGDWLHIDVLWVEESCTHTKKATTEERDRKNARATSLHRAECTRKLFHKP